VRLPARAVGQETCGLSANWEVITKTFTAYVEWDPESNLYVGVIPGIPGAHTQGATLDELRDNLKEVLELCLEDYEGELDELPKLIGLQQIEVAA
jgi:predicted RNase H-like HicB family nuclease